MLYIDVLCLPYMIHLNGSILLYCLFLGIIIALVIINDAVCRESSYAITQTPRLCCHLLTELLLLLSELTATLSRSITVATTAVLLLDIWNK